MPLTVGNRDKCGLKRSYHCSEIYSQLSVFILWPCLLRYRPQKMPLLQRDWPFQIKATVHNGLTVKSLKKTFEDLSTHTNGMVYNSILVSHCDNGFPLGLWINILTKVYELKELCSNPNDLTLFEYYRFLVNFWLIRACRSRIYCAMFYE